MLERITPAAVIAAIVSTSSASALAPVTAPKFTAPVRVTDQTVWRTAWPSITTAVVYQIFMDGKAIGIQPAYPGFTQGFSIPAVCGHTHTLNVRAGDATARMGSSTGWGPFGTRRYWTVPSC